MLHVPVFDIVKLLLKEVPYDELREISELIELERNSRKTISELTPKEMEFLAKKDKISAIKSLRARGGLNLKEAKELVDSVYETHIF